MCIETLASRSKFISINSSTWKVCQFAFLTSTSNGEMVYSGISIFRRSLNRSLKSFSKYLIWFIEIKKSLFKRVNSFSEASNAFIHPSKILFISEIYREYFVKSESISETNVLFKLC